MPKRTAGATFEQFRAIALALPGVEEGSSYGTPGFRVKKRFMARLREEDVLVLTPVDEIEKEFLLDTQPETYFITDHYRGYPAILIRLSQVHIADLRDLVERSWRALAPPKLLAEYDGAGDAMAPRAKNGIASNGRTSGRRRSNNKPQTTNDKL